MPVRGGLILAALALLVPAVAGAQAINLVGRWAVSADRCADDSLLFERDGSFASTLDGDDVKGSWKLQRDRVTLVPGDEPDRPVVLHVLDHSPGRLLVFDESIEADRRLTRCRE